MWRAGMTDANDAKMALLVLAGESVTSYTCDTCGWVEEFELAVGLPECCPACRDASSLIVQYPVH